MMASDFAAKLRKLNSTLRIFCGDDDSRAAGIFHVVAGEYEEIVGIDKNYVPEYMEWLPDGRIYKGGWRRAIRQLIQKGLVDRRRAERLFSTDFTVARGPQVSAVIEDRVQKEITACYTRNMMKMGKPVLHKNEVMDLAREIQKEAIAAGQEE